MSNIINTKSYLFKLYSDRLIRTNIHAWDTDDVLCIKTNVCHYARNVFLQAIYRSVINVSKLLGFLILTLMVLVPIVSTIAWLVTDNPFIAWLGPFGYVLMSLDIAIIAFLGVWGIVELFKKTINPFIVPFIADTVDSVATMSPLQLASQWIKDKHGKICTTLTFDRESNADSVEDDQDWDRE